MGGGHIKGFQYLNNFHNLSVQNDYNLKYFLLKRLVQNLKMISFDHVIKRLLQV